MSDAATAPRLQPVMVQLQPRQVERLGEMARRSGAASRAAAVRILLTLGLDEWERRNGPLVTEAVT